MPYYLPTYYMYVYKICGGIGIDIWMVVLLGQRVSNIAVFKNSAKQYFSSVQTLSFCAKNKI